MDTYSHTDQEKINMRELIETIFKGKILIAIITIAAIIISGVFSFFFLVDRYEAKTVLLANPFNFDGADLGGTNNKLVEYLTNLPSMTIETYLQQILSPDVLNNTISALDLRGANGKYISASSLRSAVRVNNLFGTNLLEITVNDENPELAAKIANTLAQCFIQFITDNTRKQGQQAVDLIANQLVTEESNLDKKSQALNEYFINNPSINVLKGTVNSLTGQIVSYGTERQDVEKQITADAEALLVLLEAAQKIPGINPDDFRMIIDLDNLYDIQDSPADEDNNASRLQLSLGADTLSIALLKVKISNLQTRLASNTSMKKALEGKIKEMNTLLTETQIQLTEEEYKFNVLNRDLILAEEAYDAYQQKYKGALLASAADIGKTSVIVSSEAIVPEAPVSPNRILNIMIAAFLGIILGVCIVLFMDYWKKNKTK